MELQWRSDRCSYLRCSVREVQNQEQTLELRITDGMPDIGRVLCGWGQLMLRSKQWRGDGMQLSGGINAWVLYAPEDGSEPRCVEGWIPFQAKWNFPDSQREGVIRADGLIRSLDVRTLSARKLMVRASLALLAEALEPEETAAYVPDELPEGVFVKKQTYPLRLPREAGEKVFAVEESLQIPGETPRKLLCCRLLPKVTEQAALGGSMVMRGHLRAQYVYIGEDDRLHSGAQEVPFAQFAELDRDYDKDATASVMMALSNAECSLEAGQLLIKCTLIGQYMIHERCMLELCEDAYSPFRTVTPQMTDLLLPAQLDSSTQLLDGETDLQVQAQSVVDVAFQPDYPVPYREQDRVVFEIPGVFQVLYYDPEGNLQSATENWAGRCELPAGENARLQILINQSKLPTAAVMGDRLRLTGEVEMDIKAVAASPMPMATGLELGEMSLPDPNRPSLILRKGNGMDLWELAKHCGSTVEAIQKANQLTEEPASDRILLIPVM